MDEIKFVKVDSGIPDVEAYEVHPDDYQKMDDKINAALRKAGLPTLEDLRKDLL